jgi:aryl-alcohol dehydrogenase-like predicted oxidoreductase
MAAPAPEGEIMEMRAFGKTDMQVTVLGFGGAEIGYEKAPQETVSELLNSALDAGLNVIDTAECYHNSEELIGQAIAERRKDFHLFTKCGHPEGPSSEDWRPDSLIASIHRSLRRLKTDHVDLVQLHSCSEAELRKGDVITALQKARDQGCTRYIGYSGDSKAALYAVQCGKFDTLQISVSIADQEAIQQILPLAREHHMGVIAKRPIANAAWRYDSKPKVDYHQTYWERLQKLNYPFLADASKAADIALRFTLSIPGVHTAIVGTKNPERWHQNAAMLEAGHLPQAEIDAIRERWNAVASKSWVGQT